MNSKAHEMCERSAELILSGEWVDLPPGDDLRSHIDRCPECQSRIAEVRFFEGAFSADESKVYLEKKRSGRVRLPSPASRSKGMSPPWLGGLLKISAFAAAACLVAFLAWNQFQPEGIGRVAALEGEATLRRAGSRTDKSISEETRLFEGDLIRTETNSKLLLRLEESNDVHLNESTEIRIEATRLLHHNTGETWFEIAKGKGEFEVETRGADVMVLGTSFGVRYSDDEVRVPVSSGKVRLLTKGGQIDLEPGHIGVYSSSKPYLPPSRKRELDPDSQPAWILQTKTENRE